MAKMIVNAVTWLLILGLVSHYWVIDRQNGRDTAALNATITSLIKAVRDAAQECDPSADDLAARPRDI